MKKRFTEEQIIKVLQKHSNWNVSQRSLKRIVGSHSKHFMPGRKNMTGWMQVKQRSSDPLRQRIRDLKGSLLTSA